MSVGDDSLKWATDPLAGQTPVLSGIPFAATELGRRELIRNGIGLVALASGAGGLLYLRRANKIHTIEATLGRTVDSGLRGMVQEQDRHVQAAIRRLRDYLHGPPLEMYRFAEEVCSLPFAERLARMTAEADRQQAILSVFEQRVISPADLTECVREITTDLAFPLSDHWNKCCLYVWHGWREPARSVETSALLSTELTAQLEQRLRTTTLDTVRLTAAGISGGSLLSGIADATATLVSMWPIVGAGTGIGWLAFAVPSLLQLVSTCLGWSARATVSDLKKNASKQYSIAARQIVAAFGTELSRRVALLAVEQRQTLASAAHRRAEEAAGWL